MWDLPRPGLEPMSPALADRFLTTGPPGKTGKILLKSRWSCWGVSSWVSERLWLGLLQPEHVWDSRWLKTLKDIMYNFLLKRVQQVEIGAHIPCQMKKQTETPGVRCLKVNSEFFQQIVLQKMSHQRGLMLCHVRSIIHFWSSRTWMTQGKSPSVFVKPWKSSSYELSVWNPAGLGWNLDSFTS